MDTYTQQELIAKSNATQIVVEINNRFCVNCHKANNQCSLNKCFWKQTIANIRELYNI